MKQITSMSRLVNQLEKMFRMLNADFFDGVLEMPVITVTPSSRSYAHYTPWNAWTAGNTGRRELNIASGTLDRPLEAICASLAHEMIHMLNDTVLNVQDTSRNGTYHNKAFALACEGHGLICTRTDRYGWAKTEPSDELLDWLLLHDELREIELCRINPGMTSGAAVKARSTANSFRWMCPCCGITARTARFAQLVCGDCDLAMIAS